VPRIVQTNLQTPQAGHDALWVVAVFKTKRKADCRFHAHLARFWLAQTIREPVIEQGMDLVDVCACDRNH
jgi:hypothetical protein